MSYSIVVKARSKEEAKARVVENFATIVASQPYHNVDREAAVNVAKAFIDLLRELAPGEEITMLMWGSLGWSEPDKFVHGSVSVDIKLTLAQ